MTETLECYCPLCGKEVTELTITAIMEHYKKEHNVTLLSAISAQLENAINNSVIVQR